MKLNYDRRSKDPTYFAQVGIRNGKKTTTRNVARTGKHSELLKITDDPLAYALQQVKLLDEAYKKEKEQAGTLQFTLNLAEKIKSTDSIVSKSTSLNIGYFVLQKICHNLDIGSFFKRVTSGTKVDFDPNLVNRFMTYARIMFPDSKLGTHETLSAYYEQPDFSYMDIMRTMDILEKNYDGYISHLFEASGKLTKRDTSVCYYDCTNFYCETTDEDADYTDMVTGETIKGLRKYGCSKEHRPNPLVQMGLLMDRDGIPLSMCIASGNESEQRTVIPLEKKLTKMLEGKKFVYCADTGLGSFNIRNFNSMGGRAFVVTQSVKKLSDLMQQAVFDNSGYKLLSDNSHVTLKEMSSFDRFAEGNLSLYNDRAYKVIPADVELDLGFCEKKLCNDGTVRNVKAKGTLKQKVIVTFSRKMMEYQRYVRNCQIERAVKLLENINPDSYRKGPNDVTRFIKRVQTNKSDKSVSQLYELDVARIKEEEKYDGFYAVATNLEDRPQDILEICGNRYKIEDCFRVMKTDFEARPVYHRKRERIIAHFLICYTALLVLRLLQKLLAKRGWHFTVDNIVDTLRNMNVTNLCDLCYLATYTGSQVCNGLNDLTGLNLNMKCYVPATLNKKIKQISK